MLAVILVFLSYSSADLETAKNISSRLQASGCEVWDYQERTRPGDDWRHDVEVAMEGSDVIMLLISRSSKASPYTRDEWAYARVLQTEYELMAFFWWLGLIEFDEPRPVRIVAVPLHGTRPPMIVARFVWMMNVEKVGQLCTEGK